MPHNVVAGTELIVCEMVHQSTFGTLKGETTETCLNLPLV